MAENEPMTEPMTEPTTAATTAPTTAHPPAVALEAVAAGYGETIALRDVSFELEPGGLLAIVGPNGAGKSTLLKVIAGLLTPWRGRVEVFGSPPARQARRIAYVPQAELVDWRFPVTATDVVMMGRFPRLGLARLPGAADHQAVEASLERVGMADLRRRQIGALSGGQRRRVFLARALASEAALFLLDEPVTGIDAATQDAIMEVLQAQAASGCTVIATTHDLACAAECFRRVIAINRTIVADGPASIALDPEVLASAYSGHLLVLGGGRVLIDDAHHHDQAPGDERHYHETRQR
jgi:ABC-type Mn2+/Zn2+ transport system ATPase subunit